MRRRSQTAIGKKTSQKRKVPKLLMIAIREERSCMYGIAAMSMTDELDRLKSRAIGRYISLERRNGIRVHATKRSNAVVAKTPTLHCSRAVAGRNDEVWKTDANHCGRQS